MPNQPITHSAAWAALEKHQAEVAELHMRDLFAKDPERFQRFSLEACGLLLDYSKNRITQDTLPLLLSLARHSQLKEWIDRMFSGEPVNNTEHRPALHVALRRANGPLEVNGEDVMPKIQQVLAQMRKFSEAVREGEWKGFTGKSITDVVNIGIGGSDLGPKMVNRALQTYHHPRLKVHFVSNLDATNLGEILPRLNPETTLFIVASKTFSTQETLTNARTARAWLLQQANDINAVSKHFVAISTHHQRVTEFGINPANMFEFWDWVGGRYSLWSAIGLSIAVMTGMDRFLELLSGAEAMDEHFRTAPHAENLPVVLGLLGIWYSNFFNTSTHAILPYDYALQYFPAYLQQLEMESNGKRVTRGGEAVSHTTCPVIWGEEGNNGQHAFYQLLHQGTQVIPADFIVAVESQHTLDVHQEAVLANALAQTRALMLGRTVDETRAMLEAHGVAGEQLEQELPHRVFPGNQPTSTILYQKLTPFLLGTLIALYEHKVFVQSVCWGINPFDQWGVELGKQMASSLMPELGNNDPCDKYDASTNGLLNTIKSRPRSERKANG